MSATPSNVFTSYTRHRAWSSWSSVSSHAPAVVSSSSASDTAAYDAARHHLLTLRGCRYCGSELLPQVVPTDSTGLLHTFRTVRQSATYCPLCGWWILETEEHIGGGAVERDVSDIAEGVIDCYDVSSVEVPVTEVRRYLASHREDVAALHPAKFEQLVASVFRDFFDCEVVHVGGPGDNGIDALAIIGSTTHLIQAKRRKSVGAVESVATVREFLGALIGARGRRGHLVTTASGFSRSARRLASSTSLREHQIELNLVSFEDLFRMLSIANKRLPAVWAHLVK